MLAGGSSEGGGRSLLRVGGAWTVELHCRNKFVEFDMKPVCKKCYEKFPLELKKRLKKLADLASRKAQPKPVDVNSA